MRDAFIALQEHRLPDGYPPLDDSASMRGIHPDGTFEPNLIIWPSDLPRDVRDFVAGVAGELADAIQRTALALRWRHAGTGDHQPFSSSLAEWSLDGEHWKTLPSSLDAIGEIRGSIKTSPESVSQIEALIGQGLSEPIGHSLLREAWEQQNRNPRSALIIGVAALEVGVKQCIASLEPASVWLLENLQSPSVEKMLKKYLPRLKGRNDFKGKTLPPPAGIMQTLHKAVEQRNQVAHVPGVAMRDWNVRESLEAIRDVLWLLDFYQGHVWALEHLRRETRSALVESSN
jgi:hypothetical protein